MTKLAGKKYTDLKEIAHLKVEKARRQLAQINDQHFRLENEQHILHTAILKCRADINPASGCAVIAVRHSEALQLQLELLISKHHVILQQQENLAEDLRSALGVQLQLEHIAHE